MSPELLFLDIQMPGMNGFELLARLAEQPFVIFTTAYDEYALRAFEVNSIDYLLKPIEAVQLERSLKKLGRIRPAHSALWQRGPELKSLLRELAAEIGGRQPAYPDRVASRVGERITFVDLDAVTHFLAHDKLTYAVANGARHCVDQAISELERRLDPAKFLRIHRAVLVNVGWIQEVSPGFGGKVFVSLRDRRQTRLPVARDRVSSLKSRLGI